MFKPLYHNYLDAMRSPVGDSVLKPPNVPLPHSAAVHQWYSWPEVLGASHDSAGGYVLAYLCYVLWALVLGLLAVRLVRTFAPYACGSGIPEVRGRARWSVGITCDCGTGMYQSSSDAGVIKRKYFEIVSTVQSRALCSCFRFISRN